MKTERVGTNAVAMLALAFAVFGGGGCGGSKEPATPIGTSTAPPEQPVHFMFDSLDARPVNADATRGKPTLLVFVTTGNLGSQAQVDFLVAMAKRDGEKVNYVMVALEPRDNRELVEFYRNSLNVTFPTAVATPEMLPSSGFGDVSMVPTTVLLDPAGKIVWKVEGRVAKSDEIRARMHWLERTASP